MRQITTSVVLLVVTLIAVTVAGCGSTSSPTSPESHSLAGIKDSGTRAAADMKAGRYTSACEGYGADSRKKIAAFFTGGCVGLLSRTKHPGQLFSALLAERLPGMQISGDVARYNGVVAAKYERGRWRFEVEGLEGSGEPYKIDPYHKAIQEEVREKLRKEYEAEAKHGKPLGY
jgi:hypothetical protein